MAGFTIEHKLRPCIIKTFGEKGRGQKGLFHGFYQYSIWKGSKNGYIPCALALIEFEDGGIKAVNPMDHLIIFVDKKIDEYDFPEEKEEVQVKEDPEFINIGCGGPFDEK